MAQVISLKKGQKINLTKENGSVLDKICLGVNWGMIKKKGFFGGTSSQSVDLDASAILLDEHNNVVQTIYFGDKKGPGITHSGDDRSGDDEDDGLDNEVIQVTLSQLHPSVVNVGFVLNSYEHQKFDELPYAGCRIFEGKPDAPTEIFAKLDVSTDSSFKGRESMIMGSFYKEGSEWKFQSIGKTTEDRNLSGLVKSYVKFVSGN